MYYTQDPVDDSYLDIFQGLNNDLFNTNDLYTEIKSSYLDYKTLHCRKRRSILPFLGDLISFLFGTVSESDLEDIRKKHSYTNRKLTEDVACSGTRS